MLDIVWQFKLLQYIFDEKECVSVLKEKKMYGDVNVTWPTVVSVSQVHYTSLLQFILFYIYIIFIYIYRGWPLIYILNNIRFTELEVSCRLAALGYTKAVIATAAA